MKKNNLILICGIVFGVTLILSASFLIFNEMNQARDFCISINETYSFSNFRHNCNGIPIHQYNSFFFEKYWAFTPRDDFKVELPK